MRPSSFKIRIAFFGFVACVLTIFDLGHSQPIFGREWADLRVRFVYDAEVVPKPEPIVFPTGDPTCMPENLRPISESLLIDPETKGIRNIVLYPDTKKSNFSPDEIYPLDLSSTEADVGINLLNCSYQPHVVAIRSGGQLRITNSDGYGHSPSLVFFVNTPESRLLPPNEAMLIKPLVAEKAPTPIQCHIHPWMKAFVIVTDHPYVGISDQRGQIVIPNLPVGKELIFRVWHESLSGVIGRVAVGGRDVELEQNRLKLKIDVGGNDLGTVKLLPVVFAK